MEPADDSNAKPVSDPDATVAPPELLSSKRNDLGVVTFTALTCLFGGVVLTLAYLSFASILDLLILVLLILIGSAVVFLLIQSRNTRQAAVVKSWTQTIESERAASIAALEESELTRANQHAQLDALESKLAALAENPPPLRVPHIFGWETLGIPESEIAPQLPILAELFQGHAQVHILKKFSGGHRNRGVYQVRASAEAERIVKIARSADIRAERRAQELINRFSQNNGGQYVRDVQSADDAAYGGIVYRLASLRRSATIMSFDAYYRETQNPADCASRIEQLYTEALPHSVFRQPQATALFQEYTLPPRVLDKVSKSAQEISAIEKEHRNAESVRVRFGENSVSVRNPLHWAEAIMPRYSEMQTAAVRGVIHGDLHSGNLLIESPGQNLWIIDFAKTRADAHTLSDYARLETDLKFYLLPSRAAKNYFEQALRLEEKLLAPRVSQELDLPLTTFENYSAEFQKAAACILALRRVAVNHRRDAQDESVGHFADASVLPYYLALFHATLRTLKYEQCDPTQKTYAFVSAGMLCERITQLVT